MRAREQVIGALVLACATFIRVLRIAEAKCDAAVGSLGVLVAEGPSEEFSAYMRLHDHLVRMGQAGLAGRLEDIRRKKELWVAPGLGQGRWAAYVESLGLVRRIYIRRMALLNPRRHLYPADATDVPERHQAALARLSLAGAMRHELAHYDGALEEAAAYKEELAWYEGVSKSAFLSGLQGEEREAWEWALETAMLSARKADRDRN